MLHSCGLYSLNTIRPIGMSILSEKEFISSLSVAHDSVVVYPVNVDGVFDSAPATLLAGGVFPLESR